MKQQRRALTSVTIESEAPSMERATALLVGGMHSGTDQLRSILEHQPDINLVAEITQGPEAFSVAAYWQSNYILVAAGSAQAVLPLLRHLRAGCPRSRLILFADDLDRETIAAVGRVPTDGYINWSDVTAGVVADGLYAVAHRMWQASGVAVDDVSPPTNSRQQRHKSPALTANEEAVLLALHEGLGVEGTARRTFLSIRTVERANASLTAESDPSNNRPIFTYSGSQLSSVVDTQGRSTSFTYTSDLLTAMTDPAGHTYSHAYDASKNLITYTDAGSKQTTFAYDASGNLTQITDPLGVATELFYQHHHMSRLCELHTIDRIDIAQAADWNVWWSGLPREPGPMQRFRRAGRDHGKVPGRIRHTHGRRRHARAILLICLCHHSVCGRKKRCWVRRLWYNRREVMSISTLELARWNCDHGSEIRITLPPGNGVGGG